MSYILDALRRADAERQRGAVPGLHAQAPTGVLIDGAAAPGGPARRLGLAAAVLLLLGLALLAAWLLRPGAAPTAAAAGPVGPAAAVGPVAAAPPALAPPALAVPAPAARLPPAPPAAVPMPLPVPMPIQQAAPTRRPAPSAASPTAAAETAPAPTPAQPAPVAAPARLPSLAELPEAQKRELGPLLVGGAMHAEQAALRIVILNGQVFHEGDKLSPELQVQQIRLRSVVMSHRGQHFELPF